MTLVPTIESKQIINKYEEMWSTNRYLIRSITKDSDDSDEKYMKIKFNSDDEFPLNKTINKYDNIIRAIFHENNKYNPQFFLDECLHKLKTRKKQKLFQKI